MAGTYSPAELQLAADIVRDLRRGRASDQPPPPPPLTFLGIPVVDLLRVIVMVTVTVVTTYMTLDHRLTALEEKIRGLQQTVDEIHGQFELKPRNSDARRRASEENASVR